MLFRSGRGSTRIPGASGLVLSASSESVSVLIRALSRQLRTEVLSRPQIMTLDNQEAFIQVGQSVPLITASSLTTFGATNQFSYQDIGIIVQVLPKINPDGTVVMRVAPQISSQANSTEIQQQIPLQGGGFAPVINVTQASTTVSAEDGQTEIGRAHV